MTSDIFPRNTTGAYILHREFYTSADRAKISTLSELKQALSRIHGQLSLISIDVHGTIPSYRWIDDIPRYRQMLRGYQKEIK